LVWLGALDLIWRGAVPSLGGCCDHATPTTDRANRAARIACISTP
jgi:hypothetical protein